MRSCWFSDCKRRHCCTIHACGSTQQAPLAICRARTDVMCVCACRASRERRGAHPLVLRLLQLVLQQQRPLDVGPRVLPGAHDRRLVHLIVRRPGGNARLCQRHFLRVCSELSAAKRCDSRGRMLVLTSKAQAEDARKALGWATWRHLCAYVEHQTQTQIRKECGRATNTNTNTNDTLQLDSPRRER